MKTSIQNLFAAALVMVTLSSATLAANANDNHSNYTALTQVKNVNKIVVSGNVKLILVQDAKESVEVYDSYYAKNALIQQQNGELRISSYNKSTLTVIAHVNNLSSIEASNTATVSTSGRFNLLNLSVTLNDQASASINANTINIDTRVNDSASLSLEGSTESHSATVGNKAKMRMDDFAAQSTNIKTLIKPVLASNVQSRYADLDSELLEKIF